MLIGYARVSTLDQNSALQLDALKAAGCERIFEEKASGAKEDRPELAKALDHMRKGDVLVVWKLDRLARSLKQLVLVLEDLGKRGVGFRCLAPAIDTTSPEGRLLYSITGAFAEFEREIIRQRTKAGLKAALTRGRKGGRPKALSHEDLAKARAILRDPLISVAAVAGLFGISRTTIYTYLPEARTRANAEGCPGLPARQKAL
jgi:DNA invertase Pin-like site-specific DNA recombinase